MDFRLDTPEEIQKRNAQDYEYISKRLYEYDPAEVSTYLFYNASEAVYRRYLRNCEKIVHRMEVECSHLVQCSPVFLDQLGCQIQKQIEKEIGITDIHKIPKTRFLLRAFFEVYFHIQGPHYFNEIEDGICYSYMQCRFCMHSTYGDKYKNLLEMPIEKQSTQFWVRFYSLKNQTEPVDTKLDVTSEDVKFEIIDFVPKTLPAISDWPDEVRNDVINTMNDPRSIGTKERYEKPYTPNAWKEEAASCINWILDKVKKEEEREERKKRAAAQPKKQIPVECPKVIGYWPDISYILEMKENVTDEMTDELNSVLSDYFEGLKGPRPEFYTVRKSGEKECMITIDFGECNTGFLKRIIKVLEKSGIDIEKITIDG